MANLFVSKNGLTLQQLKNIMIFHLGNFNSSGAIVDENTIHKDILSDDDGVTGSTSSKKLYKGIIRFTIVTNGHQDSPWPLSWMDLSVTDLANKIF